MKTNLITLKRLLLAGAVLVMFAGCNSAPKQESSKEQAVKQWNTARAGVMHSLARDQFQTGNFDKARGTVDEALKVDPDSVPLYVLSARIAIEQNRLDVADRQLAEARKRDEKNAEALYLSGVVAQRWQKLDEALSYYSKASDAQPTELAYLMARAEMLVQLNRRPEALSALQDKVIFFEHSAPLRDAVGQLLMQERRYPEAAEMFRQATILTADDFSIRERYALALFQSGDAKSAAIELEKVVAHEPYDRRADLFTIMGESYLQTNRLVEARQAFQKAVDLDSSSTQAWLGLSKSSLALNDLRRAESSAKRAVSIAPERADTYLMLGYVRLKQARFDESIQSFQTASSLDPTDSVALCLIGQALEKKGKHEEALSWYGRALKMNPRDEMAQKMLSSAQIE